MPKYKPGKRTHYKLQYQRRFLQLRLARPKLHFSRTWANIKTKFSQILFYIKRKPIKSFVYTLVTLIVLILISNFLLSPKAQPISGKANPKEVQVFRIGASTKITVQAQIEKAGVIKINALTGGVIWAINVSEGNFVQKGTNLIQLATNYRGGNAFALQSAIAARQFQQTKETSEIQKEIIQKQREIANQTGSNFEKLRDITNQSVGETQSLIDLNQSILDTVNSNVTTLQNSNTDGVNNAAILQNRQIASQLQGGLNQLKSQLRSAQYQTDTGNPPTQLASLQRDITLKQLDIQEKSLQIGKEISQLQLSLAFNNEALMHPVAPFAGTIQRIHVHVGQSVAPGAPLLTLAGDQQKTLAVAKVPLAIAKSVSTFNPSILHIDNHTFETLPSFVSTEATDGELYSISYEIPDNLQDKVTNGGYISIEIPLGYPDTISSVPFIPLDSVFQTQTEALVYVVKDGKASSRPISLGNVLGGSVAVTKGLTSGDQIILTRTVIEGDPVQITNP